MPWNAVLVVTFWVLVLHTRTKDEDIARIISTHIDGYSGISSQSLLLLWQDLYCNLQEWPDFIFRYRAEDALVRDVVAAVQYGRPKIPAFPRELEAGTPCSKRDVEEVRAWMRFGGRPGARMVGGGVSRSGPSWLLD